MLIEHRAYTLRPGNSAAFWALQQERGFELVRPIMERLIAYFATQSGPLEQIVHLYRFDSYDDWTRRLHGLYGVAALESYFKRVRPLMLAQENRFLVPAPIAELTPLWGNGNDWLPGATPLVDRAVQPALVVEESTLIMLPGSLPTYWQAYREHGLAAGNVATANLVGCFYTLVGRQHQVTHYRHYPSYAAQQAHAAALAENARWKAFMQIVAALAVSAETKLLAPAPIPQMAPLFLPSR
jgi:hypothetical protein